MPGEKSEINGRGLKKSVGRVSTLAWRTSYANQRNEKEQTWNRRGEDEGV